MIQLQDDDSCHPSCTQHSATHQPSQILPFTSETNHISSITHGLSHKNSIKQMKNPIPETVNAEKMTKKKKLKKNRPRKTLTKELINQLNELFEEFQQQSRAKRTSLRDIAKHLKIGYSTILRKHKQFKAQSYVPKGKRLQEKQISTKIRVARCLILNSIKSLKKCRNARFISNEIFQKYGIQYQTGFIYRILRKIGFKKVRYHLDVIENGRFLQQRIQSPLQGLLKLKKSMIIYAGKYVLRLKSGEEIKVALLASRLGVSIKFIEDQTNEIKTFENLLKEYSYHYDLSKFGLSYLAASSEDIRTDPENSTSQITDFRDFLTKNNLKLIILSPSERFQCPLQYIYYEISSRIIKVDFSRSEIILVLPQWLKTQQESSRYLIGSLEDDFSKMDLSYRS